MNHAELSRLYDFTGRTVVLTGAMGVIGGEIACALVGMGANVAMLDRNLDPAREIVETREFSVIHCRKPPVRGRGIWSYHTNVWRLLGNMS